MVKNRKKLNINTKQAAAAALILGILVLSIVVVVAPEGNTAQFGFAKWFSTWFGFKSTTDVAIDNIYLEGTDLQIVVKNLGSRHITFTDENIEVSIPWLCTTGNEKGACWDTGCGRGRPTGECVSGPKKDHCLCVFTPGVKSYTVPPFQSVVITAYDVGKPNENSEMSVKITVPGIQEKRLDNNVFSKVMTI